MFEIEYKGGNGIVLSTKKMTALVDPKLSVVGLKDISTKGGVEIATEARFATNDDEAQLRVEGPGEYEIGPFAIHGIATTRHLDTTADPKVSTMYKVVIGDVRIAVIGNISPVLTDAQLEELGLIDILILPVGGNGYTLDATSAASVVRSVDPKVVIPTSYADSGLKYEVAQDPLELFIKELGAAHETVAKYKVKAASSLPVGLTVVEVVRD